MRTIVNVTNLSADGVQDRMEDWHFEYTDDALEEVVWRTLEPCDVLLIGRESYESFAEVWPTQTGRVADRLNSMRKVVASRTMTDPAWEHSEVVTGDLGDALAALKAEDGGDVMSYGIGPVVRTLVERELLDDLYLLVNPVLAGAADVADTAAREQITARLRLRAAETLDSGVAVLWYGLA